MREELISLDEAVRRVMAAAVPLQTESVPLAAGFGRALAEDVRAVGDVQPFDNSAMDGYAVRAGDGSRRRVAGESRAGSPAARELAPGEAFVISTGAEIPSGADAVVPVERTAREGEWVSIEGEVHEGEHIRRTGEDMRAGSTVLRAGARIGSAELAVLAAAGRAEVPCVRRPRAAVLVTGSELVPPGSLLGPGQIHESNGVALRAQLMAAGAEADEPVRVGDDATTIRRAIGSAIEDRDLLIACGGVSVGEHDHVRGALAAHGVERSFWGIALKPGKPTWFGVRGDNLAFGLPGNPVSAMVTFELLVRPAIDRMLGRDPTRRVVEARLGAPYRKRAGRTEAVRCSLRATADGLLATPAPTQGSHQLTSMLGAHALAILPAEASEVGEGEVVRTVMRDEAWL